MTKAIHKTGFKILTLALSACFLAICWANLFTGQAQDRLRTAFRKSMPNQILDVTEDRKAQEAFQKEIERILKDTRAKNQSDLQQAVREISRTIDLAFGNLSYGVDRSIEELTSWTGSAILIGLMIKDKVSESVEADARVNRIFRETFLDRLISDLQKVEITLTGLNDQLEVNRTRMNADLANAAGRLGVTDKEVLNQALQDFTTEMFTQNEKIKNIAADSFSAAVGLGMTAVFIRCTVESIKRVLQAVVSRFIKTQAVSAGLAAADGPLPLGDVVAVVVEVFGVTWCTYTMYKSRIVLKNEIKNGIEGSLRELRRKIEQQALQHAEVLAAAYGKAEDEAVRTLKAELN